MITESTKICGCGHCRGTYASSRGCENDRGANADIVILDDMKEHLKLVLERTAKEQSGLHDMRMRKPKRGRQ